MSDKIVPASDEIVERAKSLVRLKPEFKWSDDIQVLTIKENGGRALYYDEVNGCFYEFITPSGQMELIYCYPEWKGSAG
ncbi:hypothetical protein [Devosia lacusdianchii]|uniref:hypothetical protein n=1 Tax=Devosia lacusdianchii TaxID=2917991 RepID=UPI001F06F245|nr:hypothetical protein [Devosia sp. JXJ CY 41]